MNLLRNKKLVSRKYTNKWRRKFWESGLIMHAYIYIHKEYKLIEEFHIFWDWGSRDNNLTKELSCKNIFN